MNHRDAPSAAADRGPVHAGALPPAQYLILEVLASRWRLSEQMRTFRIRMRAALAFLQGRGMLWWEHAGIPRAARACLTDTGRAAVLLDSCMPPAERRDDLASAAPKTWAGWTWLGWVPAGVRNEAGRFWAGNYGRGPRAWLRGMQVQHAPDFGTTVTLGAGFAVNPPPAPGCHVHAWNDIGRLVIADGSAVCTSFNPGHRRPRPAGNGLRNG